MLSAVLLAAWTILAEHPFLDTATCHNSNHPVASAGCLGTDVAHPASAPAERRLHIIVSPDAALEPQSVDAVVTEAARIWRPAGLAVHWGLERPAEPGEMVVPLVIEQRRLELCPMVDGRHAIGWISFDARGLSDDHIHLSVTAVDSMLVEGARVRSARDALKRVRSTLLARALGRTLAHEIGHFVLQTKLHTANGLMRDRLSFQQLFGPSRPSVQDGVDWDTVPAGGSSRSSALASP